MQDVSIWQFLWRPATPLWAFVVVALVMAWRSYPAIMAKINERKRDLQAEKHGDWTRLRDLVALLDARLKTLEGKCEELEKDLAECHRRENEERRGRLEAEAQLMGRGAAAQDAQRIVSTDRMAERDKKEGGK